MFKFDRGQSQVLKAGLWPTITSHWRQILGWGQLWGRGRLQDRVRLQARWNPAQVGLLGGSGLQGGRGLWGGADFGAGADSRPGVDSGVRGRYCLMSNVAHGEIKVILGTAKLAVLL